MLQDFPPFSVLVITLLCGWHAYQFSMSSCGIKQLISEKQNPETKMEPGYISHFSVIKYHDQGSLWKEEFFGLTGPEEIRVHHDRDA